MKDKFTASLEESVRVKSLS
eukprot:TCALIF_05203-PB protein Name:"Protein of unknown function" AED:0.29 eAED:0.29 QI:3/1/0.5/1/1/1/2/715/19